MTSCKVLRALTISMCHDVFPHVVDCDQLQGAESDRLALEEALAAANAKIVKLKQELAAEKIEHGEVSALFAAVCDHVKRQMATSGLYCIG